MTDSPAGRFVRRASMTEEASVKPTYEIVKTRTEPQPSVPGGARLRRRRPGYLLVAALLLLMAVVVWAGWETRAARAYNMDNLIRLHVVGASDDPADQAVKIEVRDAILKASGDLFTAQAPEDAAAEIEANLEFFREVALDTLRGAGFESEVTTEFGVFSFPERAYGPLVLPAGDYQALRVVLGEGRGANWWCVLFPPLCYLDVVGGGRESVWGFGAEGVLIGRSGRPAAGAEAIPLSSLSPEDLGQLEEILGQALVSQTLSGTGDGVGLLVTGVPGNPEFDLLVVVADTGKDGLEVRFFVVDQVRALMRSLARALPWLFGGESPDSPVGLGDQHPDR
jgi:stage II sporulation protein R